MVHYGKQLILVLLLSVYAWAQGGQATQIRTGSALPTNCSAGGIFYKTVAPIGTYECSVPGSPGAWRPLYNAGYLQLQTNGVDNGSQVKLNLVAGTNVTLTDSGTGSVTIDATGGGGGTVTTTGFPASGDVAAFSGSTSITTATSTNIINLFTGCSGTDYLGADGACHAASGSGTVTSFSAGTLSPLFTTGVATATTTPALSFVLSNAAAHTFFGNNTGSTAAPAFSSIGTADLPFTYTGNTTKIATSTGTLTSGHAATWDASGNIIDGGSAPSTGTVTTTGSPTTGAIAAFSGSTSITDATAAEVVALFSACSGTQYLGADGTCHAAGGSGTVTSIATTSPITGGTITSTGTIACATCAIGPGSSTANHLAKFSGTDGVTLADGGTIPSAGALVLVEQHTASASATLDFTSCITSTYDEYMIEFVRMIPATNAVLLELRFSTDGGSTYDSGAHYGWSSFFWISGATGTDGTNTGATFVGILGNSRKLSSTASNGGYSGTWKLYDPLSAVGNKFFTGQGAFFDNTSSQFEGTTQTGSYQQTTAVNAFQVFMSSGNIASGTVRCYGVAK